MRIFTVTALKTKTRKFTFHTYSSVFYYFNVNNKIKGNYATWGLIVCLGGGNPLNPLKPRKIKHP